MRKRLPRISIITPSYNQSQFIRQTIESVLSQKYPYLEYIVKDGGSTDGTVDILKQYCGKIIWSSQKDRGQSYAINKGLQEASGEIVGYLNSDDYLVKDALLTIGNFFTQNRQAFWVTGKCRVVDEKNYEVRKCITIYKNFLLKYLRKKSVFQIVQFISQPATFWRRSIISQVGYFDESLHYSMDYDYWLKIWQQHELYYIDKYLSAYRVHRLSKAVISPETQFQKEYEIIKRYTSSGSVLFLHKVHSQLALTFYKFFLGKR